MKIVFFCHSLLSDWNHGNAHFLRGICSEVLARGHNLTVYEPENSWSYTNLIADGGEQSLVDFEAAYPLLRSNRYQTLNLEEILGDAQLAIVHEWTSPELIDAIGTFRAHTDRKSTRLNSSHPLKSRMPSSA